MDTDWEVQGINSDGWISLLLCYCSSPPLRCTNEIPSPPSDNSQHQPPPSCDKYSDKCLYVPPTLPFVPGREFCKHLQSYFTTYLPPNSLWILASLVPKKQNRSLQQWGCWLSGHSSVIFWPSTVLLLPWILLSGCIHLLFPVQVCIGLVRAASAVWLCAPGCMVIQMNNTGNYPILKLIYQKIFHMLGW